MKKQSTPVIKATAPVVAPAPKPKSSLQKWKDKVIEVEQKAQADVQEWIDKHNSLSEINQALHNEVISVKTEADKIIQAAKDEAYKIALEKQAVERKAKEAAEFAEHKFEMLEQSAKGLKKRQWSWIALIVLLCAVPVTVFTCNKHDNVEATENSSKADNAAVSIPAPDLPLNSYRDSLQTATIHGLIEGNKRLQQHNKAILEVKLTRNNPGEFKELIESINTEK